MEMGRFRVVRELGRTRVLIVDESGVEVREVQDGDVLEVDLTDTDGNVYLSGPVRVTRKPWGKWCMVTADGEERDDFEILGVKIGQKKVVGRLEYDRERDRYLIVDEISGEELVELHCGHALSVWLPDGWKDTRIEYGTNLDRKLRIHRTCPGAGHGVLIGGFDTEQWYLVGTPLTGWQLGGLFVRLDD